MIDATLAQFSADLIECLDQIPLAQLRATLPTVAEYHREEVLALLDLCLEGPTGDGSFDHHPRLAVVDYLVTLLATRETRDLRVLRCDPCRVTPLVAQWCEARQLLASDPEMTEIEQALRAAVAEIAEVSNVEPVVRRMRALKLQLGARLFVPTILRAVVDYNVAVGNRGQELMDQTRHEDAVMERASRALEAIQRQHTRTPDAARRIRSVFESPGVAALEDAISTRLQGAEPEPGLAAKVAATVDVSGLEDEELRAFTETPEEGASMLVRAAIVVGLALRDLPALQDKLHRLEIDVDALSEAWVHELNSALGGAVRTLAAAGNQREAEQLARTQARFLPQESESAASAD
ncbi:MAG: hypothetical protein MJE66_11815 [Proteobacteria bacterium]|nr:hypothetical protein [Pseudomonadota bacterium]